MRIVHQLRGRTDRSALRAAPVLLATALVAGACVTPPGGGGGPVPECPARQIRVLERTDDTGFSIVRGMSANGEWLVTSRAFGTSLELTLRAVDAPAEDTVVGTIPDVEPSAPYPVAISDVGDAVVFDGRRWDRSSGSVVDLPAPAPGAVYQRTSRDGRNARWSVPQQADPIVVDSLTDTVLGWTDLGLDGIGQGSSRNGRFVARTHEVVDLADGSTRSFAATAAALSPGWDGVFASSISDDGSVVLLNAQLEDPAPGPIANPKQQWWTLDLDSGAVQEVASNGFDGLDVELAGEVSDDARVVLAGGSGFRPGFDQLTGVEPDGSTRRFHRDALVQRRAASSSEVYVASEDLAEVAYTAFTSPVPPTVDLTVASCT